MSGQVLAVFPIPGAMAAELRKYSVTDVRAVLPSIRVPILLVHGTVSGFTDVRSTRYVAAHIPDAKFVEVPTRSLPWGGGWEPLSDEIEEFLTGARSVPELERAAAVRPLVSLTLAELRPNR